MRISDWSSDVCSSDLAQQAAPVVKQRERTLVGQPGSEAGKVHAREHFLEMRPYEKAGLAGVNAHRCTYSYVEKKAWNCLPEGRIYHPLRAPALISPSSCVALV